MIERKVIVKIPCGMHIRPAGILSHEASKFESRAYILFMHHTINVHSLLNLVASGIKVGDEVMVQCDGVDEEAMMDSIVSILEQENIDE